MARSLNVETFTFEVESKAVGCHALITFALFYNIAGVERHVIIIGHKAKGAHLGYDMLPSKWARPGCMVQALSYTTSEVRPSTVLGLNTIRYATNRPTPVQVNWMTLEKLLSLWVLWVLPVSLLPRKMLSSISISRNWLTQMRTAGRTLCQFSRQRVTLGWYWIKRLRRFPSYKQQHVCRHLSVQYNLAAAVDEVWTTFAGLLVVVVLCIRFCETLMMTSSFNVTDPPSQTCTNQCARMKSQILS